MGLENLSPAPGSRQKSKRIGRGHGSGHGKTSGKGHKGQKSRTGVSIPAWFEGGQMPLYRRVPKRGFKPISRRRYQIVNLSALAELAESEIGPEQLKDNGLISSASKPVKILGDGATGRAVTVRAHAFSSSAREKIEADGGQAELIG
ncbi:MAG: 50S ribosomal protein L15 [marine benthic group bacterium]|nr:50S ribosomal protein L15 [Gemmatimonadota bacterium]MCL7963259.1 50S ribosomal protein L15 [Candidatus Carthagonibacter metallireducens]MCL7956988.1 50S ribosomal protein L15 [Gemmatimonadota bacterium]MCL7964033.1 50S ribosomal protein L15 [Gemmatimonadota bacterium]MCL7967239.1 50S ribosomal protein L15 [Gemmatimonadota bacterium]